MIHYVLALGVFTVSRWIPSLSRMMGAMGKQAAIRLCKVIVSSSQYRYLGKRDPGLSREYLRQREISAGIENISKADGSKI